MFRRSNRATENVIELKGAFPQGTPGLRATFVKLDEDKIALVQMLYDDGRDMNNPAGANLGVQATQQLRQAAVNHIRALPEHQGVEILELVVISPIGHIIRFPYLRTENVRSLTLFVNDVHNLFEAKRIVALDLWNFAGATEELIVKIKKLHLSYIDLFQVYKDHGDSLNLTDNEIALLPLQIGVSEKLVCEAIERVDPHSATALVEGHISHIPSAPKW